jgi:hypothetical protein
MTHRPLLLRAALLAALACAGCSPEPPAPKPDAADDAAADAASRARPASRQDPAAAAAAAPPEARPAPTPAAPAAPAAARRCGWLHNPTPGNWWLVDRDGEWILGTQGGYQAPGMDEMPDMSALEWEKTNGHYGHGCACLTVKVDAASRRVTQLSGATPLPLAQCRADRALPKP